MIALNIGIILIVFAVYSVLPVSWSLQWWPEVIQFLKGGVPIAAVFIGLIAFNKPFLAQKLSEGKATTVGIPIAIGTIILSWVFTGIYIRWANNKYDGMVKKVKEKVGG